MTLILSFLVPIAQAEVIYLVRDVTEDGDPVSWWGSRTVFVGHDTWLDREPVGVYNENGYKLVTRPDFVISGCDLRTSTCATTTPLPFGGLPDNTEVKFVTSGKLPGGLVAWKDDHSKVYYIRGWSGKSFKLAATPGGPPISLDKSVQSSGTHGMSFAGYMHVMTFTAANAIRFTCDPATDVCTSAQPHGFLDGARFYVSTNGELPGGLRIADGGQYQDYCLAYLGPTTFKIRALPNPQGACTATLPIVDIKTPGRGIQYIYGVYIPGQSAPGTVNKPVVIRSLAGYPKGTVLNWRNMDNLLLPPVTVNGMPETSAASFSLTMIAKVPAVTAPGDYHITVDAAEDRTSDLNPSAFHYTLKAVAVPVADTAGPKSYPPIPGLKMWESIMTSNTLGGGSDTTMYPRCANRKYPDAPLGWLAPDGVVTLKNTGVPYPVAYSAGGDQRVWFYNDETFFKIAKYTGDASWANCGIYIAKEMRDKFLIMGPTSMQGYFYFPWTMVGAYQWTHDPTYKEAVVKIADSGLFAGGVVNDFGMREHAFSFERQLAKEAVTGQENPNMPYYAEATLAQLYINATGSPERFFNEPFMLGLAMRPLIRWYMISHDERIPVVVKLVLDRLWNDWYDKRNHHFYYNPEPAGPRCNTDCHKYTGAKLNNLVSPAFAWYWRLTGDDTYRVRGDDLFSHTYDEGTPYSAKEWSQGYYWSWDFVEWREGKKPAY